MRIRGIWKTKLDIKQKVQSKMEWLCLSVGIKIFMNESRAFKTDMLSDLSGLLLYDKREISLRCMQRQI